MALSRVFFGVCHNIILFHCNGVVAAAAATTAMMVCVRPINNTRINIECRLKLDRTQCGVASEKKRKEEQTNKQTNEYTNTKKGMYLHTNKNNSNKTRSYT